MYLSLADPKQLGSTDWADTLSCGSSIFQSDTLWILNFPFSTALHAISLHFVSFTIFANENNASGR